MKKILNFKFLFLGILLIVFLSFNFDIFNFKPKEKLSESKNDNQKLNNTIFTIYRDFDFEKLFPKKEIKTKKLDTLNFSDYFFCEIKKDTFILSIPQKNTDLYKNAEGNVPIDERIFIKTKDGLEHYKKDGHWAHIGRTQYISITKKGVFFCEYGKYNIFENDTIPYLWSIEWYSYLEKKYFIINYSENIMESRHSYNIKKKNLKKWYPLKKEILSFNFNIDSALNFAKKERLIIKKQNKLDNPNNIFYNILFYNNNYFKYKM